MAKQKELIWDQALKIQLNPGGNLTYQDYASDIWEILAYNRTQHKDIMSELNVQLVIVDGTIQRNCLEEQKYAHRFW